MHLLGVKMPKQKESTKKVLEKENEELLEKTSQKWKNVGTWDWKVLCISRN